MVACLTSLEGELHTLTRQVAETRSAPPDSPTRLGLLFDLHTLLTIVSVHPHMDDQHLEAAKVGQDSVWTALVAADEAYHRSLPPAPTRAPTVRRPAVVLSHLCPRRELREAPCAVFASQGAARKSTAHPDATEWTAAGSVSTVLTIDPHHRRPWFAVSPWSLRSVQTAEELHELLAADARA